MRPLLPLMLALTLATPALAQYPGGGGSGGGGGGGRHGDQSPLPGDEDGGFRNRSPQRPSRPIPKSDFEAAARVAFAEADLDHNGYVTLDEIRAAREARRDAMINARFSEIDTNHDGSISHDEFVVWERHMGDPELAHGKSQEGVALPPDGAGGPRGDHGPGNSGPGGRGPNDRSARSGGALRFLLAPITANMIIEADTNHDGNLSLAEDLAYQDARFDKADSNHDDFLDEGEIQLARSAQQDEARGR